MSHQLTIFYDGGCPLCVREMKHLKRLDKKQAMAFENIHEQSFSQRFGNVDVARANAILHGMDANGNMLYGLDVTHAAWSLVGRGWLTAPLRWPGLSWIADKVYLGFAGNRNRISKLLTGKERCEQCSIDN
ncbi:Predicted thiol-disulfide oxidoreductase YuxK, DCC family [Pseudidiomarina planktonica]|uniref:Predicted thiol-disulfide oxidoreductase YuxK, DCC family n=1 Tax=Pseudidiomarina planktonica TaxID=1323738 RepID=A0A1Y6EVT0_9GAMM|nr:DUF393 domain-containing protein [Pseudidiomarina planktonica]RUO65126.1 DUF393 domain-containing protein [Pseudidiomarina planktonica]SMQ66386.1 Predicted thiol-disulfide oxidoreductase YuxK, DCC family [Pseudidiomarina planktonica]